MDYAKRPGDITTLREALQYISFYAHRRSRPNDEDAAACIVGLGGNNQYEEWLMSEPKLSEIMAIAADLEWSNGDLEALRQGWDRITELITQLQQRYS
jgi:hypothetical protein